MYAVVAGSRCEDGVGDPLRTGEQVGWLGFLALDFVVSVIEKMCMNRGRESRCYPALSAKVVCRSDAFP